MVAKTDTENNSADLIKYIAAGVLTLAGLVAFYSFADQSLLARTIGLLVVFGIVAFILYQTTRGKNTVSFFKEARTEVRKVVWPSRAETTQTTLTVFVIVFLVGLFLWLLDMLLSGAFKWVTGV